MIRATFSGLMLLVLAATMVSAKECYFGNLPDHQQSGEPRWVLAPVSHPCECERITFGGLNTVTPGRSAQGYRTDAPFFSATREGIRERFDCPDDNVPVPDAASENGISVPPTVVPVERSTDPAYEGPVLPDCQALLNAGNRVSGVYTIYPPRYAQGLQVYCDMGNGKGWIVFQRRMDGSVEFNRGWDEYRDGFGDPAGEFWLGNEALHRLTTGAVAGEDENGGRWKMRVDLEYEQGSAGHVVYPEFSIGDTEYTLHVSERDEDSSTIGDSLSSGHNGAPFSTYDRDRDGEASVNCAFWPRGGWWFNLCNPSTGDGIQSHLNGAYSLPGILGGIVWGRGTSDKIVKSEMKLRLRGED